jgi:hypothetical protein
VRIKQKRKELQYVLQLHLRVPYRYTFESQPACFLPAYPPVALLINRHVSPNRIISGLGVLGKHLGLLSVWRCGDVKLSLCLIS